MVIIFKSSMLSTQLAADFFIRVLKNSNSFYVNNKRSTYL